MKLLRDIAYFAIFCLMVLGIGGVMYHAVGKGGWIERGFGGVFSQGLGTVLALVVGGVLIVWFGRRWMMGKRSQTILNDFLLYGVVALGLFFAARLILYGSL
ncbi:MAG: hypothetical protein IT514_04450 [Burkholderiales bacterium]|nr:hypothetical protein [Burkholderiales bacterium]